jgi:hypothetical protein
VSARWVLGGFLVVALGAAAVLLFMSYLLMKPGQAFEQRVGYLETISYQTGGVAKVAMGPREVVLQVTEGPLGSGPILIARELRGEAIPLRLVDGRTVYALPKFPYEPDQRNTVLEVACDIADPAALRSGEDGGRKAMEEWARQLASASLGPCHVPQSSWPILVEFADSTKPETVERLLAAEVAKQGAEPQVLDVSVASSPAKVEVKLAGELPWLNDASRVGPHTMDITGPGLDRAPIIALRRRDFSSEVPK